MQRQQPSEFSHVLNLAEPYSQVRMMKTRGYSFITLEEALKDKAYGLPEESGLMPICTKQAIRAGFTTACLFSALYGFFKKVLKLMRIRLLFNFLFSLTLILSLTSISNAQRLAPDFRKIRLEVNRKSRPNTSLLPAVSKVELLEVGQLTADGEIASIKNSKLIEGLKARRIAAVRRSQSWDFKYSSDCHLPVYAIKFYAGGKLILYTSICWQCWDVQFLGPGALGAQGFNAKNRAGQELLRIFKEAFPQ